MLNSGIQVEKQVFKNIETMEKIIHLDFLNLATGMVTSKFWECNDAEVLYYTPHHWMRH